MSSAVGPRGPRPPTVPPPMPELPDLSHLTEEERNIILAVMDRQKEEEEKEEAMLKVCYTEDLCEDIFFPIYNAIGNAKFLTMREADGYPGLNKIQVPLTGFQGSARACSFLVQALQ
ncbi:hypothetical protein MJG53_009231 [Ovis ammon polii x Ovis aries]|uniref:RabBD domain-containing protein n=3 Tax=Ovis TaxID=9935 RepID=A0A836A021_SHEEP|nr:hypothetical protein JEQ12_019071 [Ovis aries]KAI4540029.1 hypothetical protein MG293_010424 [Ovis ammon polii]KAI4565549.1 hypothetical protein MJT46_008924 [Ovis ammon polii x Ovis aries]KAI4581706.1 hypothetical protein MJG53_009231 [Ovis ammon polii x Ovis aries]